MSVDLGGASMGIKREDPREGRFMVKTPQCGSIFLNQILWRQRL